jgi:hypothetical protein
MTCLFQLIKGTNVLKALSRKLLSLALDLVQFCINCYYFKEQNVKLPKLNKVSETANEETGRKGKCYKYKIEEYL